MLGQREICPNQIWASDSAGDDFLAQDRARVQLQAQLPCTAGKGRSSPALGSSRDTNLETPSATSSKARKDGNTLPPLLKEFVPAVYENTAFRGGLGII